MDISAEAVMKADWPARADEAQRSLKKHFYNEKTGIMNQWFPREYFRSDDNFYYWWHAHVLDVLIDAYERNHDPELAIQIREYSRSLRAYNGGTFLHNYYDDMEWTALALLRAFQATGEEEYKTAVLELWTDIQTAWNDHFGGGMAWKKDQLDYKNTPANAPAAILAARLYSLLRNPDDLEWAVRIFEWNQAHLVDPGSGLVWDGINRLGDGRIDYDWAFTYCQGVFLGAGVELYRVTGEQKYADAALRTAHACINRLCDQDTLLLPDEGIDDTGLFKGILIRYFAQLEKQFPGAIPVREVILANADALWNTGLDHRSGLCGPSWELKPVLPVQLSVQLSGLMLLEGAAIMQKTSI
ncbi:glycoside hydrolase family 76 protein [Paenibacillus sp. 22594]|uniref:glycoside hydrolase family 76 protein n=1 Tax=Paenibacillus sp. 22594 TaxID=3453947 RepID=UPI003F849138